MLSLLHRKDFKKIWIKLERLKFLNYNFEWKVPVLNFYWLINSFTEFIIHVQWNFIKKIILFRRTRWIPLKLFTPTLQILIVKTNIDLLIPTLLELEILVHSLLKERIISFFWFLSFHFHEFKNESLTLFWTMLPQFINPFHFWNKTAGVSSTQSAIFTGSNNKWSWINF